MEKKRIAVLVASLAKGGIGKMRVRLASAFAQRGYRVDMLLADLESPYLERLDPQVRVIPLPTTHPIAGVLPLARHLRRERPDVLLTQRIRVHTLAMRAMGLAKPPTRVFVTLNTHLSRQLESLSPEKGRRQLRRLRRHYPRSDGIFAVSRGVAEDGARLLGMPPSAIRVLPNPTVAPEVFALAEAPPEHPWFGGKLPVILAMGRLEPQKDFPTLLKAFARVRKARPCRLVILGEGKLREALLAEAQELGIAEDLDLPGFAPNPYPFLAHAALFVLSSRWEGSPNALVEALALGTPCVATDCPSGPREILKNGRFGPLVAVGDDEALASAMLETLKNPLPSETLRQAAEPYGVDRSASAYLEAMGLA
ncbi:MAG: glycosyltransferase [Gammaproteobacteria bacterium]|nr:MAG: glycosyltransferase [Gammaproteobacteria bacterium]